MKSEYSDSVSNLAIIKKIKYICTQSNTTMFILH